MPCVPAEQTPHAGEQQLRLLRAPLHQVPRKVHGTAVAPHAQTLLLEPWPGRASAAVPKPLATMSSGGCPPAGGLEMPWMGFFIHWGIG